MNSICSVAAIYSVEGEEKCPYELPIIEKMAVALSFYQLSALTYKLVDKVVMA